MQFLYEAKKNTLILSTCFTRYVSHIDASKGPQVFRGQSTNEYTNLHKQNCESTSQTVKRETFHLNLEIQLDIEKIF